MPSGRRDADDADVLFLRLFGRSQREISPISAPQSVHLFLCGGISVALLLASGLPTTSASPFPAFLACRLGCLAALLGGRLGLRLRWFGHRVGRLRWRVGGCLVLRRCLRFFGRRCGWGGLGIRGGLGCRRRIVFDNTVAEQSGPSGIECFGGCPRLGIRSGRRFRAALARRFCVALRFGCLFIRGGFCLLSGRGGVLSLASTVGLARRLPGGSWCVGRRRWRRIYIAFDNILVGEETARAVG